jgi:hypothetical protein
LKVSKILQNLIGFIAVLPGKPKKAALLLSPRRGSQQQRQIETLTAGLRKMRAQLEVTNPPRRTVLNNH